MGKFSATLIADSELSSERFLERNTLNRSPRPDLLTLEVCNCVGQVAAAHSVCGLLLAGRSREREVQLMLLLPCNPERARRIQWPIHFTFDCKVRADQGSMRT
jgi:hypothetical protein